MSFFAAPALLFITIASATPFPNSTNSTTSRSTTSNQSLIASSAAASDSWTSTCLYDPGFGYGDCNRPGDPVHAGYPNPYDTSLFPSNIVPANPSLASFCSKIYVSEYSQFLSTAVITTTTYPGYTDYEENPPITYTSQELDIYYNENWYYTATPPCCLNCTLFGGNVQVYYWPTPAPSPPVSRLVNAAGFTL